MEERDIIERVSTLEEQVRGISEIRNKIDVLYNLLMEIKLENATNKSEVALKSDCTSCRKEVDAEIEKLQEGRTKVLWALISTSSVFMIWLLEQVLHITLHIG